MHAVCVVGAHEQAGELEVGACGFVKGRLEGERSEENGGLEGVWVREVVYDGGSGELVCGDIGCEMMVKEGRADAHVEPNLFPVCNIRFDFDHVKWDAQSVERPHGKDGEGSERREQVLLFPKKKVCW